MALLVHGSILRDIKQEQKIKRLIIPPMLHSFMIKLPRARKTFDIKDNRTHLFKCSINSLRKQRNGKDVLIQSVQAHPRCSPDEKLLIFEARDILKCRQYNVIEEGARMHLKNMSPVKVFSKLQKLIQYCSFIFWV